MSEKFFNFFRGNTASSAKASAQESQRVTRRSNGLQELSRSLAGTEGARVLDLGPTSPQNLMYFSNLGQKVYNEDLLLASCDPVLLIDTEEGKRIDTDRFITDNLVYDKELFDAVLCWDLPDYLESSLVKPVVQRIHSVMKPKGLLLAFFHTRDAGPDAPYHRYHIVDKETLEMQRIAAPPVPREPIAHSGSREAIAQELGYHTSGRNTHFRLQRVFNNRHIENLFHDFASIKFFLGRDNIREVLVVR